ncbi:hypothetical protein ABIA22_004127 [Sinorhizobium fredii]|uniref:Transposase n=1 Tax=Sinorhizobium fredii (strain USDA 257) TaxID=1185652 RepID=I3XG08_SINF2|nr:transposase [Sinorhizobium fredii USDA 257]AWI62292.1 hypothetical protein AB395_00006669 [Sinorhizobium fredii CCBAU 45436]CCE99099.1 hypothetical protein SFHH103_04626 [Sinorhizobium fredii HH103]CEO91784.1 transposon-related [Sinorhizobium fredii HH103]
MLGAADLPDDIAALKAMLIAAEAREVRKDERIERLEKLVAAFKQAAFGRKSEKSDPDQFDLALEDLETAIAAIHAEDEADAPSGKRSSKPRATNRGSLPVHLPCVEEIIEPESLICVCGGCLHCIGEDVSERLDVIPAQFRVIVTRRPKYACRACTDGVVQAPASARLIQGGFADGGHGRACTGRQIRRSSSSVSAGADHEPPGYRPRPLHPSTAPPLPTGSAGQPMSCVPSSMP